METRKVFRINAFLHRGISKEVLNVLNEAGVHDVCIVAARSVVLQEKRGFRLLLPGRDLISDPMDHILFLVGMEMEPALFNLVVEKGHLGIPGMGSVISEEVEIPAEETLYNDGNVAPFNAAPISVHPHAVMGICCIVQRGKGEGVARLALDTGTCVPSITFGVGTGVRDKMGLLRITIPAEKEVIHVFSSVYEAVGVFNMMAEAGDLEQPGKGYIYTYPVKKAVVNMRVIRGGQQHVASIEQVVAALDHIKGGDEWRRRARELQEPLVKQKRFLARQIEINLMCNGETGPGLVKAAMSAGAGGSTLQSFRHLRPPDSPLASVSPVRELCSIVVPEDRVETILAALGEAGAFTDRCHGHVHLRRIPRALTYSGRSKRMKTASLGPSENKGSSH